MTKGVKSFSLIGVVTVQWIVAMSLLLSHMSNECTNCYMMFIIKPRYSAQCWRLIYFDAVFLSVGSSRLREGSRWLLEGRDVNPCWKSYDKYHSWDQMYVLPVSKPDHKTQIFLRTHAQSDTQTRLYPLPKINGLMLPQAPTPYMSLCLYCMCK